LSEKTTTIGVKEQTRDRLAFVRDMMKMPTFDACITCLLDGAGYPTWAEVEQLSKQSMKAPKRVAA